MVANRRHISENNKPMSIIAAMDMESISIAADHEEPVTDHNDK